MRIRVIALVSVVLGTVAFVNAGGAGATVGTAAASWTPQLADSNAVVRQLVPCGGLMFAVGNFHTITQGGTAYSRSDAFSFDASTGALTAWDPAPNGTVNSIALSADCASAYVGGTFTAVGASKVTNIAKVSTSTGAVDPSFAHTANGAVDTVALVNGGQELMVGGNFSAINGSGKAYYASLNPATGAVDSYFSAVIAGRLPPNAGGSKVYNQQVSASGSHLLFEGNFTTVGGVGHLQIAELDLSGTAATLDSWSNATLNSTYCTASEQFYVRDATFSPDESTIYLATTGYQGSSPFCDTVTAMQNTPSADVEWINKTGGDSLYSVAAGPADVYIGGHQRWADNPQGSDTCGPGCVSRPGIGDISASTGMATSWNPTRSRGEGADDLVITAAGLWIASDTYHGATACAHAQHPGICFLPGTA